MKNWKELVNLIALTALADFAKDIKEHCNYGWKVGILYPDENKARYNINWPYYSYNFADAVTSAAKIAAMESHLGYVNTWVEPDDMMQLNKDEEYCKWIIYNNTKKKDYTTMENLARGAQNIPLGGIYDRTYDNEYKTWVEANI